MKIKFVVVALVCLIVANMSFAGGGTGKAASGDVVKFTYAGDDPTITGDDYWVKLVEKRFNIDLEVQGYPEADVEQKINLMAASGELPNIINRLRMGNIKNLMKGDLLLPLKDLAEQYAPNFTKAVKESQYDMDYYAKWMGSGEDYFNLPILNVYGKNFNVMSYRTDAFKEAGVEVPKNDEEFYEVSRALKMKFPDSIPIMSRDYVLVARPFLIMFGVNWVDQPWELKEINAAYKEMLKYIKKLYAEGLLDQEFPTTTDEQFRQALNQGLVLIGTDAGGFTRYTDEFLGITPEMRKNWRIPDDAIRNNLYNAAKQKAWMMNVPVKDGITPLYTEGANFDVRGMALVKGIENVERAMEFVNWCYSEEAAKSVFGVEGVHYKSVGNTLEILSPSDEKIDELKAEGWSGRMLTTVNRKYLFSPRFNPMRKVMFELAGNHIWPRLPTIYNYSDEQRKQVADLETVIKNKINAYFDKFVLGMLDVDNDWDQYLDELNRAGLEELLELRKANFIDMEYVVEPVLDKTWPGQP